MAAMLYYVYLLHKIFYMDFVTKRRGMLGMLCMCNLMSNSCRDKIMSCINPVVSVVKVQKSAM